MAKFEERANVRCLLFDLDGVLLRSEPVYFETNLKLLSEAGIKYDLAAFLNHTFFTELGLSGYLRHHGYPEALIANIIVERDARVLDRLKKTVGLSSPHRKYLFALRNRFRLGIVSNTPRAFLEEWGILSDLSSFVDFLVLREQYVRPKPNPDSYLRAIEFSGMPPSVCWAIEDSPRGLSAARRANIVPVGVPNPDFNLEAERYSDHWILGLSDLVDMLL